MATASPSLRSSPIGAGTPNRSTATIAVVRGVSAARTLSAVTVRLFGSTSQNTGRAPKFTIDKYAGDPLRKVLLTYLISDSGTTSPAHELRCFTDVACNPVEQD